jgi:alkanesulfonate monooxygenase SsuD/methylene tetrahydromethanopterin reductase-like flavin-dependent oxidoreductase (luciferase family)
MKIGIFHNPANLDHKHSYATLLSNVREISEVADETGYASIWFAEHHFSLWGREVLPNPIVLAADIAARTKNLRIGLAAAIITFWHPLRLAEDVGLLDQLCDGRLELGVGRGNYGLEALNLNPMADTNKPEENYAVFEDALNILKKACSQKTFSHTGKKYTFPTPGFCWDKAHPVRHKDYVDAQTNELINISVYPRPKQQPWPPLWQVVDSIQSVEFAARNDLGVIMWRPPVGTLKERFDFYRATAESATGQPVPKGRRTAIMRDTFVAKTMEEARRIAEPHIMKSLNWYNWRGPSIFLEPGETLSESQETRLREELTYDFVHPRSLLIGTPDYVLERLHELHDQASVEHVLTNTSWAGMDQKDVMNSLRLFADEVLPNVPGE